ncbi:MAG TPA: 3-deoxy-manno-octulosonate cytidylyltransferase [bacterium]|nr:3-deoxy-manno-octulosonate cytidylyltransferase [Candidatus Omnitrophota bacterium]HOJ59617.1 3-deoxy-manno-octulosonate cytidylyltransferase [bacterium]HOL95808.1 3-deoxy-manno-octulosonate cytidylyltransferase [bacterium]HPP01766.1 3-deoxy-manno-octulosonate cytidylyltransferase [bacterium]HXK92778.1 3-deoxy-manno-octulosonate cytidylyltransferase [bacterium]
MSVLGVIPSRYGSTRLPGKPLAPIRGKSLIRRVYEQAGKCRTLDWLCVATDDSRIVEEIGKIGGRAVLTSPHHPSGTDRIAEAVEILETQQQIHPEIVINIQGDMPFVHPDMIDEIVTVLLEDPSIPMGTSVYRIQNPEDYHNPSIVKTVMDLQGFALYFSRSLIPYPRMKTGIPIYDHIGIYGYRRDFLRTLASLSPTPLEQEESLEQLRVLEHGYKIKVVKTSVQDSTFTGFAVDTPDDLLQAEALLQERGIAETF